MPSLPDGRHWEMTGLDYSVRKAGSNPTFMGFIVAGCGGIVAVWVSTRTCGPHKKQTPPKQGVCVRSVTRLVVSCAVRPSLAVLNLDLSSRRFQVRERGHCQAVEEYRVIEVGGCGECAGGNKVQRQTSLKRWQHSRKILTTQKIGNPKLPLSPKHPDIN